MQIRNNYKLLVIILSTLFLLCTPYIKNTAVWAGSAIEIEYEKLIGSKNDDRGLHAIETADGGSVIVGETIASYLYGNWDSNVILSKLDDKGLLKWTKTYGAAREDKGLYVQQTNDQGFIITGETRSYSNFNNINQDVYLIKTNADGTKQWQKSYGGSGEDSGVCVRQTEDDGFIIAGKTTSKGAGDADVYLIKVTASGKLEWEKTYGGKRTDFAITVDVTKDGGYIVIGQTYSFGAGSDDIYIIKTDQSGNKEWEKTFGHSDFETASTIKQTADDGYIIVGQTASFSLGSYDAYLIKLDKFGNKQWETTYQGNDWTKGVTIKQTEDGEYIIAGWTTAQNSSDYKFHLVKTSTNGKVLWQKTVGNEKFAREFSIKSTDEGYLVTGWWAEPLDKDKKYNAGSEMYVMKIKSSY